MKMFLIVILLFYSSLLAAAPNEEAVRFINGFGVGKNLKVLAAKTAMGTTTFRIILEKVGKEDARRFIVPALEESVAKHQKAWNAKLAAAYSEFFTEEQLRSVLKERRKSPHFAEIAEKQELIGRHMQENANSVLVKVVSEAMEAAYLGAIGSNK